MTFNADLAANGDRMQDTGHMQAWEGMQQGSNLNPISNLRKGLTLKKQFEALYWAGQMTVSLYWQGINIPVLACFSFPNNQFTCRKTRI